MSEQTIAPPSTADGMPVVPPVVDEHTHGGVHDPNVHHSPEEIRREMKIYIGVFVMLAILTGATVAARFTLHLSMAGTIAVALFIACVKGSLVAAFFMHLINEKKLIYSILLLTVVFFAALLWLPVHDVIGKF